MKVASVELCKELYELSGWDDTFFDHNELVKNIARDNPEFDACPAYDLGYLIRKLGEKAKDFRIAVLTNDGKRWVANRTTANRVEQQCDADTPENAACKLAIELHKQDILNKKVDHD